MTTSKHVADVLNYCVLIKQYHTMHELLYASNATAHISTNIIIHNRNIAKQQPPYHKTKKSYSYKIPVVSHTGNVRYQFHRLWNLPAYSRINTNINIKRWCVNGMKHRTNDEPAEIRIINGNTELIWCINGKRHRDNDKPAVITPRVVAWRAKGRLHRNNHKPAYIRDFHYKEWHSHGVQLAYNDRVNHYNFVATGYHLYVIN